jgi:DNA (cytosine-5)-methyltransferase 1
VPRPLAISLFSGAGGFDEGIELAGFEIALALEIDRHARETYRANFPGVAVVPGDIHDFLGARAPRHRELYGLAGIDLIFGGPPCAGFSSIGKRDPLDERNELYRQYVRVVADMRPSMFVMENVPNILLLSKGKFRDDILLGFRYAGYANAFHFKVLAEDFGVPQHRERIFFGGTRDDLGLPSDLRPFADAFLSTLKVASATTVREAIGDLPSDVVPSGQSLPYPDTEDNPSDFLRRMRLDLANGPFTLEAKRRRAVGSAEPALHNHHTKEIGRRRAELIRPSRTG